MSRILAQWLTERLGQPVLIENRPGAATNLSLQATINAPPDGYTMVYLATSATVNLSFYETQSVNVLRDLAPVSGLADFPFVLVVNKSIPSNTVAEFIAYAKAQPGKISMASFGAGTSSHLAGELFMSMTGVKLVHVPYRGEAFALADMISGHVEVMFDTLSAALPHIRSGALRALAMAGKTRHEALPDVPTVGETVPGYEAMSWGGIGVRRGTQPEIIERLARESMRDLRTRWWQNGSTTSPRRRSSTPRRSSAPSWRSRPRNGPGWSRRPAPSRMIAVHRRPDIPLGFLRGSAEPRQPINGSESCPAPAWAAASGRRPSNSSRRRSL